MESNFYYVVGIMSGTSLDGIDFIYVKFNKKNNVDFKILATQTIGYSDEWKKKLQLAISFSNDRLNKLDVDYGELLGEKTNKFLKEFNITDVDFIASHGHTVLHQPEKGITLQVGNGKEISRITNIKVICDFRTQDVKLGGQGAPLVPIGDELLFSEFDYCLNLGGFANISYHKNGKRIAFDICPVNIVLNKYAQKLGLEFDDKGNIASTGKFLMALEAELRNLKYYLDKPPKSLGLEWVQKEIFPLLESSKRKPEDLLRTFTTHIAWSITRALPKNAKVLVTGGGAYNDYLLKQVLKMKKLELVVPNTLLIEYKEALIFAFLGVLRVDNQVNCLSSVTGADKDHSSGEIFYP